MTVNVINFRVTQDWHEHYLNVMQKINRQDTPSWIIVNFKIRHLGWNITHWGNIQTILHSELNFQKLYRFRIPHTSWSRGAFSNPNPEFLFFSKIKEGISHTVEHSDQSQEFSSWVIFLKIKEGILHTGGHSDLSQQFPS